MKKVCFSCKNTFAVGSFRTSRSRLKLMGITPPEGMGVLDKICNNCLHKLYEKQIKQSSLKKLKNNMTNDLISHKNKKLSSLPKKIGLEKKKKIFR